jgi:hypothetical protein
VLSSQEEGVQQYVREHGFTMTFGIDRGAKAAFKVTAIPYTVFINRLGHVSYEQFGEMTGAEFDTQLQRIL